MLVLAVSLGLVLSLLCYEATGLSPGGMIVPGYLALAARSPWLLLNILLTSLVALLTVKFLSNYVILFSRRRFVLTVLIGFAVMLMLEAMFGSLGLSKTEAQGIGYIVPGLIANDMEKQGVLVTVLVTMFASAVARIFLLVFAPGTLL